MKKNPLFLEMIRSSFLLTTTFLFFNIAVSAQADLTLGGTRTSYISVNITSFGANPNDNLDDTWAFVKLSKWLNNEWDKNGHPYKDQNQNSNPNANPSDLIDYSSKYIIVNFPSSVNGNAYVVGKEIHPGDYPGYSYLNGAYNIPEKIPYNLIFSGVPADNTDGVDITILVEWVNHQGYPGALQYSTVFWQAIPIIDVKSNPIQQLYVDGIWFKGEPGTKIKKTSGMHLGYWDKDGEPFPSPNNLPVQNQIWYGAGLTSNYYYDNAYWGLQQSGGYSFFLFHNANNIKFTDIEIDGNKQTAILGGVHPTESIQSGSIGISFADSKKITVENVNIHHTSFDGITVNDYNWATDTKFKCKDTKLNFNGRTAFAWISGKDLTFENVEFNYAGKDDEITNSNYGNPNCGIDMEPDGVTQACVNGTFTNCSFIGNSGLAISANTNSNLVDHISFNKCTMWDGDSYGIICRAKYVTYNDCDIYCNILNFGSWGAAGATKFNRCNFEDKSNPLNPTQTWPAYNFLSGTEKPFNYLIQTVNGIPDQQSTGTTFTDCHFKVNDENREMFKIYTKDIESANNPTPSNEFTTFDGCDFTYNNEGNTTNPQTNNYSSILRGILFKGNNIIKNTIPNATSKHEWEMATIEVEGSNDPCLPFKFEVEGNVMISQTGWAPNVLLYGRKGSSNDYTGYLRATFRNNAILRFANNVSNPSACNITVGENCKLEFEPTASMYSRGPLIDYVGGYEFNLYGQLIMQKNSFFTFYDFNFNENPISPLKSLFYIDDQAIGDLPSFWYSPGQNVPILNNYNPLTAPCVQGGNANLPVNVVQCTPTIYSNVSTNGAFTIMYNLTPNGGNTDISFAPNGNDYDVQFDGTAMAANTSIITNVPDGCHMLIIKDDNTGCSAVAFITTGANTAPCCEPEIDNPTDLYQYTNPNSSALVSQFGANISNKTFIIDGTFAIDQNISFTNCQFYLKELSKIGIAAGKTLNLSSCHLQAACDAMWDGVYVLDQTAEIVMDECLLRDAENGLMLSNNAAATITKNTFLDNHENIQISGNTNANNIEITENTFTFSNALLSPYVGQKPLHGIFIDNSSSVDIGNLGSVSSGNLFSKLWNGVTVNIHPYTVGDFPFQQIFYYPNAKIQLYNNQFKDIEPDASNNVNTDENGVAVYGYRTDPFYDLRVNVYNTLSVANNPTNSFDNCFRSVWLRRASGNIDQQKIQSSGIGVVATECEGKRIKVTNSSFRGTYWNILKAGDEASKGFYATNNDITLLHDQPWLPPIGIASTYSSMVHVGKSDISYNTINIPEGNTALGIMLSEGKIDNITYNKIHMETGNEDAVGIPKMIGIYSNKGDGVNMINNTIDNGGGENYIRTNNAGIYINNNNNSFLKCNTMDYLKYGIFAVGQNGSITQYDRTIGNYMNNSDANLMLWKLTQEGTMGQVGINAITNKYDARNFFNEPYDMNPAMTPILLNKIFRITDCPQNFSDEIVTDVQHLDQTKSSASNNNINDCRVVVTNPTSFTSTYLCDIGGNNNQTTYGHPIDLHYAIEVATGQVNYSEYLDGARRADEELVQNWLANNDTLRSSNAVLDSFYLATNAGIVGQINDIEIVISLLNDSSLRSNPGAWMIMYDSARTLNNTLSGGLVFEQNAKYMNDLYLKTLLVGRDTLSAEEQEDIEDLAFTCPYVGGNAVYRARVLHGMRNWGIHYDDLEICNGQGVFKNGKSKLEEQLDMLKNYKHSENEARPIFVKEDEVMVYPNPAISEITVLYNIGEKETATFIIYDLLGRERMRSTLYGIVSNAKVNVNELETGVYLYTLHKQNNTKYAGKLLIE